MINIFLTLGVIFILVFLLIILTRLILSFLITRAYNRYLKLKKTSENIFQKNAAKKNYIKEEEELELKKNEIPRAHSAVKAEMARNKTAKSGSYEIIPSKEQQLEKEEMSQVNIVDFVKPIGFWTSMILGQKLTYLVQSAQILSQRGDKGFWASMIEAKDRAAGRQHGRGR